jgi:hypothetical protein
VDEIHKLLTTITGTQLLVSYGGPSSAHVRRISDRIPSL